MRLEFVNRSFDAVIALNGVLPDRTVFNRIAELPLIAADGAANTLVADTIVPEFVVGDLDSVTPQTLRAVDGISEVVVNPNQDTTDFEKTLLFAEEQLWNNLLVVGIHGGDLEHTLNNWSVLMRHAPRLHITVLDQERYGIPIFHDFNVTLKPTEQVSIIPQPTVRITTGGLQWELNNEVLSLGEREGGRNRLTGSDLSVELHEGSFLLVCDSRLPAMPIFHAQQ